jgi:hypothetical protein
MAVVFACSAKARHPISANKQGWRSPVKRASLRGWWSSTCAGSNPAPCKPFLFVKRKRLRKEKHFRDRSLVVGFKPSKLVTRVQTPAVAFSFQENTDTFCNAKSPSHFFFPPGLSEYL